EYVRFDSRRVSRRLVLGQGLAPPGAGRPRGRGVGSARTRRGPDPGCRGHAGGIRRPRRRNARRPARARRARGAQPERNRHKPGRREAPREDRQARVPVRPAAAEREERHRGLAGGRRIGDPEERRGAGGRGPDHPLRGGHKRSPLPRLPGGLRTRPASDRLPAACPAGRSGRGDGGKLRERAPHLRAYHPGQGRQPRRPGEDVHRVALREGSLDVDGPPAVLCCAGGTGGASGLPGKAL
ncbi:MAG: salicylate esterase, partial [uncultured Rubrobacteraceae bacterium]